MSEPRHICSILLARRDEALELINEWRYILDIEEGKKAIELLHGSTIDAITEWEDYARHLKAENTKLQEEKLDLVLENDALRVELEHLKTLITI